MTVKAANLVVPLDDPNIYHFDNDDGFIPEHFAEYEKHVKMNGWLLSQKLSTFAQINGKYFSRIFPSLDDTPCTADLYEKFYKPLLLYKDEKCNMSARPPDFGVKRSQSITRRKLWYDGECYFILVTENVEFIKYKFHKKIYFYKREDECDFQAFVKIMYNIDAVF